MSDDDRALYATYRQALRMGNTPESARGFAMGREMRSTSVFDEAIARVESDLLATPGAGRVQEDFERFGLSESAARAEALDWAWSAREGTRSSSTSPALSGDDQARLDALTEAWRKRWAESSDSDRESMRSEWGFDGERFADPQYAVDLSESKLHRRPMPSKPAARATTEVQLDEVDRGGAANLEEQFRRLGLSESAACDAARGR